MKRTRSNGIDDKVPDMMETGHSGKTNGGMYHIKADFGQTLIVPHPLDRSTMHGKEEEECGRDLAHADDYIGHSLDGCKVSKAVVTGPDIGGRKDTTIKSATR